MLIEQFYANRAGQHRPIRQASVREQMGWMSGRLAIATWLLMGIGSATRVMNAGLACPDWPLCYGTLFPGAQMNLQVFLEWFHRLDAAVLGFGLIVMVGWGLWRRRELPGWVPWVAAIALFLVVFQGILGALTVTKLLRFDMVTAHLGTALLLFGTLLGMTLALRPAGTGSAGDLRWWGAIATGAVYLQSLAGGLVASRWAVHQCLAGSQFCVILNSHLLGVVPATLAVLWLGYRAWRTPELDITVKRFAGLACLVLAAQVGLGVAALKLRLQIEPITVAHQMIGALLLGCVLSVTVLAWRERRGLMDQFRG